MCFWLVLHLFAGDSVSLWEALLQEKMLMWEFGLCFGTAAVQREDLSPECFLLGLDQQERLSPLDGLHYKAV